jgi:phage tail sheath protein FI
VEKPGQSIQIAPIAACTLPASGLHPVCISWWIALRATRVQNEFHESARGGVLIHYGTGTRGIPMAQLNRGPGVYIDEVASGVHTITGTATSIAAFIDFFPRGDLNIARRVHDFGEFTRIFGGLHTRSEASYAIQQFFNNGGSDAWVVRAASGTVARSSVVILDAVGGAPTLRVEAINAGLWGDGLRIVADPVSATDFNLGIQLIETVNGERVVTQSEVFRNLSRAAGTANYVASVINDEFTGSKLVRVAPLASTNPPTPTGTLSGAFTAPINLSNANPQVTVTIGTEGSGIALLRNWGVNPGDIGRARAQLEAAIRAAHPEKQAFSQAAVSIVGDRLRILAGPTSSAATVTFAAAGGDSATVNELKLAAAAAQANVQAYQLGVVAGVAAQGVGVPGNDGTPPAALEMIGDLNLKTGLYALERVDLFNILCLPRTAITAGPDAMTGTAAFAVMSAARDYCQRRRAFFIVDTPNDINTVDGIQAWIITNAGIRHRNLALYFPRLDIPDPLDRFRLRSFGASGTVAGICARIDGTRGVWKAPAGIEATLDNVMRPTYPLTDLQTGVLNPLAINCLRSFDAGGNLVWGARTLAGTDAPASEWKYVPVRRMALFLEESLFRGTTWVVFEPNDEPLWAKIRLNLNAFMMGLFRQGAFQGSTPTDAYFVKCDAQTTTQADRDLGIVNIEVGFAPLKPAEFVVIKIQQIAGDLG